MQKRANVSNMLFSDNLLGKNYVFHQKTFPVFAQSYVK